MGFMKKLFGTETETQGIDNKIYSPLKGSVVPLNEVNDPVFAEEMMGNGAAVIPTDGRASSPVSGEIISVFKTKHAITIKADNGADIIIHVGLDTVNLDGKHYEAHVKDGQRVKVGDLLLTFDIERIKEAGYDVVTPVVVTNSSDYSAIKRVVKNEVNEGEALIELSLK